MNRHLLRLVTPVAKDACPLCGCRTMHDHPEEGMLYCDRCSETLLPSELVWLRTPLTIRTYRKDNPSS